VMLQTLDIGPLLEKAERCCSLPEASSENPFLAKSG
jgi:hypothetical protein